MRKIAVWAIGGPLLIIGLILFVLPWFLIFGFLETIKWALLNIGGTYEWGSE